MGIFNSLGKVIGGGVKLVGEGFDWIKENPELAALAGIGVATGGFGLAGAGATATGTTAATATGAASAVPAGTSLVSAGTATAAPVVESLGVAGAGGSVGATGAASGSMLSNPYAMAGLGLLQGQLSKPDAQAQPVQMRQSNLMQQLQQQQGAGYQYRGLLS